MTHREAYIFGWVYGKIDEALLAKTEKGVPGILDPSARPRTAFAQAVQAGTNERVMNEGLERQIAAALSEITWMDDEQPESVQPLEVQGSWQLGFYHAKVGKALDVPADPLDIEGKRRAKKLSQSQLAERMGVTQGQISRWETGRAKPTKENQKRLEEILG